MCSMPFEISGEIISMMHNSQQWLQLTGSHINHSLHIKISHKTLHINSFHCQNALKWEILFSNISADNTRVEEGLELDKSFVNFWKNWFRPRAPRRSSLRCPWWSRGQRPAWCWKFICHTFSDRNSFETCAGRKWSFHHRELLLLSPEIILNQRIFEKL